MVKTLIMTLALFFILFKSVAGPILLYATAVLFVTIAKKIKKDVDKDTD